MTTANKITIGRILLVPVFIVEVIYYGDTGEEYIRAIAVLAFALAASADAVDGYIARHYNQRSQLGAILDPLADKLLLVSAVILLSRRNDPYLAHLPVWLVIIILSRDALLVLGLALFHYMGTEVKVRPRLSGKMATVLQMATVLWILLKWPPGPLPWLIVAAGALTALSGAFYLYDGVRHLSAHPSSTATAEHNPPR
ncbi:MAG TPA: CDP-alcohol phosphatidyltransferase family protein [Candidatus Baltobacteraceae bacterium]|jgi:CDP-diacylglycerol--glycerol-3-phosphate 3-phosphatidyltransferase|nr:CDP-alcohol phosphatidyltransferase family protein [Candidatus Baltobacteraceae bacterium]